MAAASTATKTNVVDTADQAKVAQPEKRSITPVVKPDTFVSFGRKGRTRTAMVIHDGQTHHCHQDPSRPMLFKPWRLGVLFDLSSHIGELRDSTAPRFARARR